MGKSVVGRTVRSETIQSDHEAVDGRLLTNPAAGFDVGTITLASLGTSPSVTRRGEGGKIRLTLVSGSGTPAIADNNVQIAIAGGTAPRKVFLAADNSAPRFCVTSITSTTINIGCKVAPAASTTYAIELIVLF